MEWYIWDIMEKIENVNITNERNKKQIEIKNHLSILTTLKNEKWKSNKKFSKISLIYTLHYYWHEACYTRLKWRKWNCNWAEVKLHSISKQWILEGWYFKICMIRPK